jgi:prolyl oligopeptidase
MQNNPKQNPAQGVEFKKIPVTYPFSKKDSAVSDVYFDKTIADPYRWLEDDQSAETKDWVQKQNLVTFGYLSQIPYRDKIKKRLEQIWNYEKFGTPFKEGGKYYFFKNDGLQNQSILYVQDHLDGKASVALDPNSFSADGTSSLGEMGFSKDGRYMAYSISTGGSDWRLIRVKDTQTGATLPDSVQWAKFTQIAWDDEGFFYTRFPAPKQGQALTAANQNSSIYYHKLGTAQSDDVLVFSDPRHPDHFYGALITEDKRFLCLVASESTSGNTLSFRDLSQKQAGFTPVVTTFDKDFNDE